MCVRESEIEARNLWSLSLSKGGWRIVEREIERRGGASDRAYKEREREREIKRERERKGEREREGGGGRATLA